MSMWIFKKVTQQYLKNGLHYQVRPLRVCFEGFFARRYYVYTINTNIPVTTHHDAKSIEAKLLGNVWGEFQLNEGTIYMQAFKRAYKQYHGQCRSVIARNIIETIKGANSTQN